MSVLARIFVWLYTHSLNLYPSVFRVEFSYEMKQVFSAAIEETKKNSVMKLLALFGREIRDWPGAVWREHQRSRKGYDVNQNNLAWRPLNIKELLAGLALFILPIFPSALKLILGYTNISNGVGSFLLLAILAFVVIIIITGTLKGYPRWSLPYLGVSLVTIIMLLAVPPIWELLYKDVQELVHYSTKTLMARIQYSVLLNGFFWLVPFVALVLLILLLMPWPRTRVLAQRIRQDWTLFSFMIYGGVVFQLELVFDEYAYDELWKITCRVCLLLGAWIYFKNADHRKRILALLAGVTLTYWIATVGKWIVLPLQRWGAFYSYDHWTYRRFELGSTLATWGWVMFFMLLPALLTRIPQPKQLDPVSEETLTLA
jgi:hypothetical protein